MTEHSPFTPPPKLVGEWSTEAGKLNLRTPSNLVHVANRAAQWGADQELEACCELLDNLGGDGEMIRRYRRPKPLSLKQQALQELDKVDMLWATEEFGKDTLNSLDTIRRAIESIPDPS